MFTFCCIHILRYTKYEGWSLTLPEVSSVFKAYLEKLERLHQVIIVRLLSDYLNAVIDELCLHVLHSLVKTNVDKHLA